MRTSQEGGALPHKSEGTQEWIARIFANTISEDSIACAKPHSTVEALERYFPKAWNNLPMDIIARAVDDFPRRLKKGIEANGGHFKQD
ncbi:hypothetical protein ANCDUO_08488 [Ancylostoma duodenale]|uniref:Uncharacterized protein n=1 Tax=Ancylostoma duodenale TaxID=51022 RepID=A0A0C2GJ56_9BILA|nr:hypothetical protein ANCDUO_08488 [Ancylostoma duodenale]